MTPPAYAHLGGVSAPFRLAATAAALGLGAIGWAVVGGPDTPPLALVVAAAAAPITVLFAVWGRVEGRFPSRALIGGAVIGPIVAIASHAFVAAFAAAFFLGFARSGKDLLDAMRVDPRVTDVLGSPWVLLLLIELTVVAPLTEEAGKALGARLFRPADRREAFLSGVAAGAGFAMVENLLYAGLGAAFGGPWPAIVLGRALGAAVHPLATGLVVVGWWEFKQRRDAVALAKRFLAGVGVHALWNGALVALTVVETAYRVGGAPGSLGAVAVSYTALLGVILAGVLWRVTDRVTADRQPLQGLGFERAPGIAAWTVLAASFLVPVVLLVLAFPGFYLG